VFSPPVAAGAAGNSLVLSPAERRVVDLPQVVAHFRAPYLFLTTDPTGRKNSVGAINPIAAADPDLFRRVDRPLVLAGRLPDPSRPFDAVVNELAATKRHLRVGSQLRLYAYSLEQIQSGGLTGSTSIGPQAPTGPEFTVRVAAIVRFPQDVSAVAPLAAAQNVSYEGQQNLYLTPAFLMHLANGLGIPVQAVPDINLVGVRLRHGLADWKAFAAAVPAAGRGEITVGDSGNTYGMLTAAASTQRGVHLEVIALVIFGVLAGLVTLLLVGQAIGRQAQLERTEHATLRSLGAASGQLAGTILVRAAVIGAAGAAIAFVMAVLASPLMPVGVARQAELHPGFELDPIVLIPGAVAIAVLVVASAALPAWRVHRQAGVHDDDGARPSPAGVGHMLARSSMPPTTTIGVRYALERGRGRSAVPVATAMISAVVSIAVLTAALTFGASLNHLVTSPHQQGWNWDVLVGNPHDMSDREVQGAALLAHNRFVSSYSAIAILAGAGQGNASIGSVPLDTLIAIDPLKGTAHPPLLEGRPPRRTNEIVLGSDTLHRLHRHVGQTVQTATPSGRLTLHIVGRMIAPSIGDLFTNHLGDGGWVSGATARRVSAAAPANPNGLPPTVFTLFAVRYAPGASPQEAFASLKHDFGPTVLRPLPAEDVVNLQSVNRLPLVLAGLVALLGIATLANTLVSSVRRRRRDLATLKTIGFVRRQISALIAWQATTFCIVALIIGIPLGIAAGRWTWNVVASGIGAVSPPTVPTLLIVLSIPVTLALGNLIALLPAWAAARVTPAIVMRNE
jgi:ABC-type lipoprotein release transport system permease subunit